MFHVCWCAEGNEVKKEIQALNSLQLDLGDLKLFEDGVKMLKKFVVSMKSHFDRCVTRRAFLGTWLTHVSAAAGQFDRRLPRDRRAVSAEVAGYYQDGWKLKSFMSGFALRNFVLNMRLLTAA